MLVVAVECVHGLRRLARSHCCLLAALRICAGLHLKHVLSLLPNHGVLHIAAEVQQRLECRGSMLHRAQMHVSLRIVEVLDILCTDAQT